MKKIKINSRGVLHHLIPGLIVLSLTIFGVYELVKSSAIVPYPISGSSYCNTNEMASPEFPLTNLTVFNSTTPPSNFQGFGYGILSPRGYKAENHLVFTGYGLDVLGYPDPLNKVLNPTGRHIIPGVVGAGFDLNEDTIYGGFDVCVSMSSGNWQGVELILMGWPSDNMFNEGEVDFFEGSPSSPLYHIHEIGSTPAINAYSGNWPNAVESPGTHLLSVRWDPIDGYMFYLDGQLFNTVPVGGNVSMVSTNHHLAVELRDTTIHSKSDVTVTIYWAATYSYIQPS